MSPSLSASNTENTSAKLEASNSWKFVELKKGYFRLFNLELIRSEMNPLRLSTKNVINSIMSIVPSPSKSIAFLNTCFINKVCLLQTIIKNYRALHELLCTFARFAQLFENVVHFSDSYRSVWKSFKNVTDSAAVLDMPSNCPISKAWAS